MANRARSTSLLFCTLFVLGTTAATAEQRLSIRAGERVLFDAPGVTAAYAINENLVDVALSQEGLVLTGRRIGDTSIVVVTLASTRSVDVSVLPPLRALAADGSVDAAPHSLVDVRYSSATGQVQTSLNSTRGSDSRKTAMNAVVVHSVRSPITDEPRTTLRSASYVMTTPKREITLFDSYLEVTPLTISGTSVRGVHVRQGMWDLHAGYTTGSIFGSVLLNPDSDAVVGGTYRRKLNKRWTLAPTVYLYPTRDEQGRRGGVASLSGEYRNGDFMLAQGEVAASRSVGGSAHLEVNGKRDHVRLDVRYQPENFSTAGSSSLRGFFSDGWWGTRLTPRLSSDVTFSANDYLLPNFRQRNTSGRASIRWAWTPALATTIGAEYSALQRPQAGAITTASIPVGIFFDIPRFGASLTYRRAKNSETNRGGNGFRANVRVSAHHAFAAAYFERQTEAPTLGVIFRERPDIAFALEDLGMTVSTPDELARLLREHPEILNLGYIEGVTVNLAPARTQAGFDVGWTGQAASRQELRLRMAIQRVESVGSTSSTLIGSTTYSRRLSQNADAFVGLSMFNMTRGTDSQRFERVYEVGVRHRFAALPALLRRSGTIAGTVFADEIGNGVIGSEPLGVAGVIVELNGERRAVSDARGRYSFAEVQGGAHEVQARLHAPGAYFTTRSRATVEPGHTVDFGVGLTPGRIVGRVVDDGGRGVGGVGVVVSKDAIEIARIKTEMAGTFTVALPPATYDLAIETSSLASGYLPDEAQGRAILERDRPVNVELSLSVARTIRGQVETGGASVLVLLQPSQRTATTDGAGNFAFRSVAAGEHIVRIEGMKPKLERTVVVPATPGVIRVAFGIPASPIAPVTTAATVSLPADDESFTLQLGAYRNPRTAEVTLVRARKSGMACESRVAGALTFVECGTFSTREEAERARSAAKGLRFDSIITNAAGLDRLSARASRDVAERD
jgi:hypothetical protein